MLAGGQTTHEETERAFLQERLALFAKWSFGLAFSTDILDVILGGFDGAFRPAWWLDRLLSALLLGVWLVCRRGAYAHAVVRGIDVGLSCVLSILVAISGRYLAQEIVPLVLGDLGVARAATGVEASLLDAHSSILILLGGAVVNAFRAAVIPSSPRLTFFVTGVLGLPFVLVPALVAPAAGDALALRTHGFSSATTSLIIWWTIITATCTMISAVIYGLRREVHDAQRLGQYTLVEKIGEGGMGIVYRAQHARLRRPTAIKLLPPDRLSEDAVARFESEVQLTAELTHPNTVTVFDYGRTDAGVFYYAMEFLDGASLAQVVAVDGAQPAARVLRILTQTAGALQEAHEVGLIHRDIKPANIMLTRQGADRDAAKLLDFGLAKIVDQDDDVQHTRDDRLVGTPLYMAPEVIRDANARSEAADIYSLGAVGYFLLTGTDVFAAETVVEVCAHHLHTEPEPPSKRAGRALPEELERLLLACLAKEPSDRPRSAAALVAALAAITPDDTWSADDAKAWWATHRAALASTPEPLDEVLLTVDGDATLA